MMQGDPPENWTLHAPASRSTATSGRVLKVVAEDHAAPRRLLSYDVTPGGSRVGRM